MQAPDLSLNLYTTDFEHFICYVEIPSITILQTPREDEEGWVLLSFLSETNDSQEKTNRAQWVQKTVIKGSLKIKASETKHWEYKYDTI